jgi:CDP-4-dehydro-6-deoxyglucose reductase
MTFKVRVLPSGHEFGVEEGESVLDAALRQQVTLPYGCRNGTCGSCKGRVIAGELDYPGGLPPALSAAEQAAGLALFCCGVPRGELTIEVAEASVRDFQVKRLPARVARKELLAPDVMRLYLKLPTALRLQFLAGQYIDFLLPDGRRRSFSLANAPHEDEFIELHVRHVDGGEFTEYVFDYMKEKSLVRIEGPHGDFYLREDSRRPVLFAAGGTGFAPIKGMLEHAFAAGVTRDLHLYWGARARVDLYLDALPQRWQQEYANFRYTRVLSAPAPGDHWQGRVGFVHEAVIADHADLSGYDVYAAGPPAMVRATRDACLARGLPPAQFYCDPFEFAPDARAKVLKGEV